MADSEQEIKPAEPVEEKPKGPTSIVTRNAAGKIVERHIDPVTHKFVKSPRKMPSSLEVTRTLRNIANSRCTDKDGKILKDSLVADAFKHIINIARGKGSVDPKADMAAVAAFKEFTTRAYGKPSISDEDRASLEKEGVRYVIIAPPNLMHPEFVEEAPRKPLVPAFIDAEFTTDPPKQ